MKLSKEKMLKKREKLLKQAECRCVILTPEGNLRFKRAEKDVIVSTFAMFHKGKFLFKSEKLQFNIANGDQNECTVALFTENKFLIYEDENTAFYVDGNKTAAENEKFLLIYFTRDFIESICINGAYGNQIFRFVKSNSEESLAIQFLRMILPSFDLTAARDFENTLKTIGGNDDE